MDPEKEGESKDSMTTQFAIRRSFTVKNRGTGDEWIW